MKPMDSRSGYDDSSDFALWQPIRQADEDMQSFAKWLNIPIARGLSEKAEPTNSACRVRLTRVVGVLWCSTVWSRFAIDSHAARRDLIPLHDRAAWHIRLPAINPEQD